MYNMEIAWKTRMRLQIYIKERESSINIFWYNVSQL